MPHDDRDEESKFTAKYPMSAFLDVIKSKDQPTTGDIANEVGCNRRSALYRLRKLEDEGRVRSEKKGGYNFWKIV